MNIHGLIDNAKCYQMVRQLRCPEGVEGPYCHTTEVTKNGHDDIQQERQRDRCRMCNRSLKSSSSRERLSTLMKYDIDGRLPEWGDEHKSVCHSHGEYTQDEDGDGH